MKKDLKQRIREGRAKLKALKYEVNLSRDWASKSRENLIKSFTKRKKK